MTERIPFELETSFGFEPAILIDADKRIPLTKDGFVPLGLNGYKLKPIVPTITDLGMGAVRLSLRQPFGFLDKDYYDNSLMRSQQTNGIILTPADVRTDTGRLF